MLTVHSAVNTLKNGYLVMFFVPDCCQVWVVSTVSCWVPLLSLRSTGCRLILSLCHDKSSWSL